MPRAQEFPITVKNQSVEVTIYKGKAKTEKPHEFYEYYTVAWVGPNGRERVSRADLEKAREFAELKAAQLASGLANAHHLSRADVLELSEARAIAGDTPVLSALKEWQAARNLANEAGTTSGESHILAVLSEWKAARKLAGDSVREACEAWASGRKVSLKRILVSDAVDAFINAKKKAGKQERTYRSKLDLLKEPLGGLFLDAVETAQWSDFLEELDDPVTRNDIRKRCVTLCRWAQSRRHLHDDRVPAIERTERALEGNTEIGILTAKVYADLLAHIKANHLNLLAPLVLAGLSGMRNDEIHGKLPDREPRQSWESIRLDEGYLTVDAAKRNTPANRVVHLTANCIAWLRLCPKQEGYVCPAIAMQTVRRLAAEAGFKLPENCFRHSYITYRIAATGNKDTTANEAGNSVAEIDRRYRVPQPESAGRAWFAIWPDEVPVKKRVVSLPFAGVHTARS